MRTVVWLWTVAFLVLSGAPAAAQDQGCVTAECHGEMGTADYVHGPVGAMQCAICHQEGDPNHPTRSGKDFQLAFGGGGDLCYGCHDRKDANRNVHKPVATGDCIACHDPHAADNKMNLVKGGSELCFECHPAMEQKH